MNRWNNEAMENESLSLGVYDEKFQDPFAAADYLESIRWPDGPVCPHCGVVDQKALPAEERDEEALEVLCLPEAVHGHGRHDLRGFAHPAPQVADRLLLLCSSQEGHQRPPDSPDARRHLQDRVVHGAPHPVRDEAAGFRKAASGTVEVDETYVGGKMRRANRRSFEPLDRKRARLAQADWPRHGQDAVIALVERGGQVRSFRVANVTGRIA